ncbi:MAG: hypothetical protein AUJ31_01115 [Parcubacteria group bacterium CG1_02_39_15]|uniref:Uncharacterized protein n=3 Tax=Bacteria candidate phyla TaxID=1783234 RepID=A0A2H0MNS7_9BACT|nr:MAG: hypothetical protein AUJ31_01115 [Parcubacteria group bacterium CG1_02_39_15]PIQ98328.1 MAG: hypothetical protein COV64_01935 [Candidatus Nealsonbacteria bacterium CG11_big_fil_rev_8_21_14_0_20_39_9]PIZ88311.1 MAG: hypothetical protein COX91_00820 [Candidatus Nealsonbacteria bacterium CG_4_10_14_0_2_um_filter_39_15]PJC68329.1 MAG: hypothetical protein CO015_04370 [candidate division WWE3 bacterium CG_4_8_14_3_um_filter_42_11]
MVKLSDTLKGFLGGLIGGAVVDLVYIGLAGPSAFFSFVGITERCDIFLFHTVLGGILGILFVTFLRRLPLLNIWLAGIIWGLICLVVIGGVPAFLTKTITLTTTISGFTVWLIFGFILAATIKFSKPKL